MFGKQQPGSDEGPKLFSRYLLLKSQKPRNLKT